MQAVTNELASLSRVLLHAPPSFTTTLASALERGNEKIRLVCVLVNWRVRAVVLTWVPWFVGDPTPLRRQQGQQAVSISQRVGQAVRVQALLADAILDDSPVTALQAQRASTTDRLYNSIDKLEAARTTVKRLRRRGQEVGPQLQQQEVWECLCRSGMGSAATTVTAMLVLWAAVSCRKRHARWRRASWSCERSWRNCNGWPLCILSLQPLPAFVSVCVCVCLCVSVCLCLCLCVYQK